MHDRRKHLLIVIFIIFLIGRLLGVKAAGSLLVPTAGGERMYEGVITITQSHIEIECKEKIFQPFNRFELAKSRKMRINTAEVKELQIGENSLYIVTEKFSCNRYRNIYMRVFKPIYEGFLQFTHIENFAIVFIVDNPADIEAAVNDLIKATKK